MEKVKVVFQSIVQDRMYKGFMDIDIPKNMTKENAISLLFWYSNFENVNVFNEYQKSDSNFQMIKSDSNDIDLTVNFFYPHYMDQDPTDLVSVVGHYMQDYLDAYSRSTFMTEEGMQPARILTGKIRTIDPNGIVKVMYTFPMLYTYFKYPIRTDKGELFQDNDPILTKDFDGEDVYYRLSVDNSYNGNFEYDVIRAEDGSLDFNITVDYTIFGDTFRNNFSILKRAMSDLNDSLFSRYYREVLDDLENKQRLPIEMKQL